MPGRKPLGDKALTPAERQARYREAHKGDGAPRIRYRKPTDRRSRAQKWRDAVAELITLQEEYRAWLESLPPSLAESSTAQALNAICEIDLSELVLDWFHITMRLTARSQQSGHEPPFGLRYRNGCVCSSASVPIIGG